MYYMYSVANEPNFFCRSLFCEMEALAVSITSKFRLDLRVHEPRDSYYM